MSLDNIERAQQVCLTCKSRKKRCDKVVPICGYCSKRDLQCCYDYPLVTQEDSVVSASHSASASCQLIPQIGQNSTCSVPALYPLWMQLNWISDPLPMALDVMLDLQVRQVIQSTNLPFTEISSRFFRDFHRWLPVVCPRLFYETARKDEDSPLPADYSVLVLSMCLITLHPPAGILNPPVSPKDLYLRVRMILAHVQSVICASPSLIQASLILAAYEYAYGRPDTALISVGTCSRMAQSIGIDKGSRNGSERQFSCELRLRTLEERNIWWGVVVLERIILCEIPHSNLRPTTKYPGKSAPLPSDLVPLQKLEESVCSYGSCNAPSLSEIHAEHVSSFGRRAQAVCLLDRVLSNINSGGETVDFLELEKLDREILSFLEVVLDECGREWGQHCPAVASTMRALFLLHQNILTGTMVSAKEEIAAQQGQNSLRALKTVTKMMADVAYDHVSHVALHNNVDALPLCCSYNLQAAIQASNESRRRTGCGLSSIELESLMALDKIFCKRWKPSLS
ncbi:hypothetical protein BGW36DRAFT_367700 [Talaromyces proteolyticus]|uniref:Zn(2)-C6 fungal-type domain-containing protein n=1 Tax=Talaromyces proteolyticus TaxID=1131652 RepID=A0AAD4L2Q1_9EURO|nr:uncharacterized protein BGW36DRAFT_367700 [Talaromyces proteolyticus]KAH8705510.1 hypothetical protein BGW36DRAFT_367700 [Talaromyces proteolyticus]